MLCDIALFQGRGEIALDRAHRISSIERHHLEEFDAVSCESAANRANSECGRTDVSLSSLKWVQAALKSVAKVFREGSLNVMLWSSY